MASVGLKNVETNEFWRLVASGLLHGFVSSMAAESNRDKRRLGIDTNFFVGKLWMDAFSSLGYKPNSESIQRCWDFVQERYYQPVLNVPVPFVVEPACDGTIVTVGAQPAGYTVELFQWKNFIEFEHMGQLDLDDNATPSPGIFVVALADIAGLVGLPCSFLTEIV